MGCYAVKSRIRLTLPEGTLIQVRFPEGFKGANPVDELVQVGAMEGADWPAEEAIDEHITTKLVPIIAELGEDDFTKSGTPKVSSVEALFGEKVSSDDVAKAWEIYRASVDK